MVFIIAIQKRLSKKNKYATKLRRENTYTNRGAEQLRADVHNAASYRDVACAQRCKAEETVHVGPGRATETENEEDEQDSMHKTIDQNTFTGST